MIPEEKLYSEVCQNTDYDFMHNVLCESRVFKNDEEIEIMRWASLITCEAHCNVMRNCKPG
jgi:Xaa-Pro aminopeptidase